MPKPFWSIMIPSYNCAYLLPKAIESALACKRAFPDTQIEVVDDCSTRDKPEEVVRRYQEFGVSFYRHPQNVGAPRNFSACAARSRGEWIHILHGDDYVRDDFYEKLHKSIANRPQVYSAFTPFIAVNETGNELWTPDRLPTQAGLVAQEFRDAIATQNVIQAPSIVVRKAAYGEIGAFDPNLVHTADWDMWNRVIWKYPAYFEADTLAYYLIHSASDSSKLMRTGENLYDALRAIKKASKYFPEERRAKYEKAARRLQAVLGVNQCRRYWSQGDNSGAFAQLKASIVLDPAWTLGRVLPGMIMPSAMKNVLKSSLARISRRDQPLEREPS